MVNGTLFDDEISARNTNSGILFQQTPKYNMESTEQTTMARFYIEDTLASAIENMYKGKTRTGTALGTLLTKLKSDGGYFDFLLSNIQSEERDRYFLSETLGNNFTVFGMGKSPEVLSGSGVLKNTQEDNWQVQFIEFFNKIGGVNSLAKLYQYAPSTGVNNKNFVTLKYNERWVQGALLSVSTTIDAHRELDLPFAFTFLVTKVVDAVNRTLRGNSVTSTDVQQSSIQEYTSNTTASVHNSGNTYLTIRGIPQVGVHTNGSLDSNPAVSNNIADQAKSEAAQK